MPRTFVIADTHFWHRAILVYENRPFKGQVVDGVERLTPTDVMNLYMLEAWNATVGPDDTVIHLGDVSFGSGQQTIELCRLLNGKKMLVKGNHDKRTVTFWERAGFSMVYKQAFTYVAPDDEFPPVLLSHWPVPETELPEGVVNVHGHTHGQKTGLDPRRWACVSVELTNYRPVLLSDITQDMAVGKPIEPGEY